MKKQSLESEVRGFFVPCEIDGYEDFYLVVIPGQLILLYSPKDVKANAVYDPNSLEVIPEEMSDERIEMQEAREEGLLKDFSIYLKLVKKFIREYKKEELRKDDGPPSKEYVLSLTQLAGTVGLYP